MVFRKILIAICVVTSFVCFSGTREAAAQSTLVTGDSAGPIRIGMTVAQARRAMSRASFRRTSDGEGIALIEVRLRNRVEMTLYAGEFDPSSPINNNAVVEFIEVSGAAYRTRAGIRPGSLLSDVQRRYGQLSSIMLSEIEAREFARFANQPSGLDFRVAGRNRNAGVYRRGETIATNFSSGAYVVSIIVTGAEAGGGAVDPENPVEPANPRPVFTSVYTNLRTQCRTPNSGNQGGHVSTFCQGPQGFQLHLFDTATTLEINVETSDRSKSVHVASQSLSFNRNDQRVEWRLRDGKPFAVIMRAYKYRLGQDGLIEYPEVRTGEYLLVRGVPGFEKIDYEVDARRVSNANQRARQLADGGLTSTDTNTSRRFQNININRLNRIIQLGTQRREAWVRSSSQVIARLFGDLSEVKTRTVRFIAQSAEESNALTVVITDDGLLDDSVRTQRTRVELKRGSNRAWMVVSARKSWRCREGRGHQNFSAAPCI